MSGQMTGNGAFAGPGGPVNRDNELPALQGGPEGTFHGGHPRFFGFGLRGAVKPKRLLLPALAPAVRAGLRPP